MLLSENEIVAILKKSLPQTDPKDLGEIAGKNTAQAQKWQEVDLKEHLHDEAESQMLHSLCQRKSNTQMKPKKVRLFFKE